MGLIVLSYLLLVFSAVAARSSAHPDSQSHMVTDSAYAHPWTLGLTIALAIAGIALALIPVRRGEAWARWTVLATLVAIAIPRLLTDPRCFVVLDPHQHGCHTFVLLVISGIVGVLLAQTPARPR